MSLASPRPFPRAGINLRRTLQRSPNFPSLPHPLSLPLIPYPREPDGLAHDADLPLLAVEIRQIYSAGSRSGADKKHTATPQEVGFPLLHLGAGIALPPATFLFSSVSSLAKVLEKKQLSGVLACLRGFVANVSCVYCAAAARSSRRAPREVMLCQGKTRHTSIAIAG